MKLTRTTKKLWVLSMQGPVIFMLNDLKLKWEESSINISHITIESNKAKRIVESSLSLHYYLINYQLYMRHQIILPSYWKQLSVNFQIRWRKACLTALLCFMRCKYNPSQRMETEPIELTWPNPGPHVLTTSQCRTLNPHTSASASHTQTVTRQLYVIHTFSVIASSCSKSAEWFPSATRSRASNKGFANSVSVTFDLERWSLISSNIVSTDKF